MLSVSNNGFNSDGYNAFPFGDESWKEEFLKEPLDRGESAS